MMLNTVTGLQVDMGHLRPENVRAYDLAWALHHVNLFGGHAPLPWDALSHAGLAYMLYVQDVKGKTDVPFSLALLLYGAEKAYVGDAVNEEILDVIYNRFNVREDIDWDQIERYDNQATAIEFHTLFPQVKNAPQLHYDIPKYPLLVKAKVEDYIMLLKHLSINHGVEDISTLFEMPDSLRPYLVQEKAEDTIIDRGTVDLDVRETNSIEGLQT